MGVRPSAEALGFHAVVQTRAMPYGYMHSLGIEAGVTTPLLTVTAMKGTIASGEANRAPA